MSIVHSRSVLKKRPVQILLALSLVSLLIVTLPPGLSRPSFLGLHSAYTQDDYLESGGEYEAALVVASQRKDDTTWLSQQNERWRKVVYVTDDSRARKTVPMNKGREAMVYLTYIIDHYDVLENVTVFIHAERYQWHNDDPDYDNQRTLSRLNMSHVQVQGYANLRCAWSLGCPAEIRPFEDVGKSSIPPKAGVVYKQSFEQLFPGVEVPQVVGAACCAQFAVSREAIRQRPKSDYVKYRSWIMETDIVDDLSGRVLEYSWHIIFGKEAVFCPSARHCYCTLYGLCDLVCKDRNGCKGQYVLPPFSTLPEGWPVIGWDGEARQPTV